MWYIYIWYVAGPFYKMYHVWGYIIYIHYTVYTHNVYKIQHPTHNIPLFRCLCTRCTLHCTLGIGLGSLPLSRLSSSRARAHLVRSPPRRSRHLICSRPAPPARPLDLTSRKGLEPRLSLSLSLNAFAAQGVQNTCGQTETNSLAAPARPGTQPALRARPAGRKNLALRSSAALCLNLPLRL